MDSCLKACDFFSGSCDEILALDIEDQLKKIRTFTFSNFVKSDEVQCFLSQGTQESYMPELRFTYIYFLFRKIGDFIGTQSVLPCFRDSDVGDDPSVSEIFYLCRSMSTPAKLSLCCKLELLTRGQSSNVVWEVLRDGVISSSKFSKAIKGGNGVGQNLFHPNPIRNDYYVASPLAFGLRCEPVVKTLITKVIYPEKTCCDNCGFLLGPQDGLFGVSLDLYTNVTPGEFNFSAQSEIYEIKCRFKYLFGKNEFDPLLPRYRRLYDEPNSKNFASFVYGISKPAVEFVPEGRLPSENDYLLSSDLLWNVHQKRKRRMTNVYSLVEECISFNSELSSTVYLLTDPSKTGGVIRVLHQFEVNVFINPRHQYFSQLLLQSKVVGDYLLLAGIKPRVKNYVVTAFFRKRDSSDPQVCLLGSDAELPSDVEIPVLLLVTPVYLTKRIVQHSLKKATQHWETSARETFKHPPWVPSYPPPVAV